MNKSHIRGSGRTIPGIPCIWVMWDSCLDSFPYVYQVSIEASSKMRRKCHIHYEGFLDLSIKNDSSPSTMPPTKDTHLCSYIYPPPTHTISIHSTIFPFTLPPSIPPSKEYSFRLTMCQVPLHLRNIHWTKQFLSHWRLHDVGCACSLSLSLVPGLQQMLGKCWVSEQNEAYRLCSFQGRQILKWALQWPRWRQQMWTQNIKVQTGHKPTVRVCRSPPSSELHFPPC